MTHEHAEPTPTTRTLHALELPARFTDTGDATLHVPAWLVVASALRSLLIRFFSPIASARGGPASNVTHVSRGQGRSIHDVLFRARARERLRSRLAS